MSDATKTELAKSKTVMSGDAAKDVIKDKEAMSTAPSGPLSPDDYDYEARNDEQRQYAKRVDDHDDRKFRLLYVESLDKANVQRDEANAQRDRANVERDEANARCVVLEESLNEARAQRDNANARCVVLEESLNEARAQRDNANAQCVELEESLIEARAQTYDIADRSVPLADDPNREEMLVMMRMSANYQRADTDPAYLRDCTVLFIRCQSRSLDARIRKVLAFGDGTNTDATVCHTIDTPNAVALFNAFRELAHDGRVVVLHKFGGTLVGNNDGDAVIDAVIQLMDEAHGARLPDVIVGDDDELGGDDDELGGDDDELGGDDDELGGDDDELGGDDDDELGGDDDELGGDDELIGRLAI